MNYQILINKAQDYIEENLDCPIKLAEIAAHIGLSKFHFHRVFRSYLRETPHQYITRTRLERSFLYMIARKDLTITEIAYRYGYHDASAFSNAFRQYFNTTPTDHRDSKILQSLTLKNNL